tara:strand:- start:89 stop:397 length:309 start_codon:yes stop_codon:yes gene_type:complete
MANEKNTVNYCDGNSPEDLTPCCGEQPRQGWSFMGSFIWCNQCGEKMHSSTLDQWELGEKWNTEQRENPRPLTDEQARKWSDAENASRAAKDLNVQHPDNAD